MQVLDPSNNYTWICDPLLTCIVLHSDRTHLRCYARFSFSVIRKWVTLIQLHDDGNEVLGMLCANILQVQNYQAAQRGVARLHSCHRQGSVEGGRISLCLRVLGMVTHSREKCLENSFCHL